MSGRRRKVSKRSKSDGTMLKAELEELVKQLEAERDALAAEIETLKNAAPAEPSEELDTLRKRCAELESAAADLTELESLRARCAELEAAKPVEPSEELEALRARCAELEQQRDEAASKCEELQSEAERSAQDKCLADEELAGLRAKCEELQAKLGQAVEDAAEEARAAVARANADADAAISGLNEKYDQLVAKSRRHVFICQRPPRGSILAIDAPEEALQCKDGSWTSSSLCPGVNLLIPKEGCRDACIAHLEAHGSQGEK